MKELSIKQRNNLITGNVIAAEIPSTREKYRAFVVVWAYYPKEIGNPIQKKVSKFLNGGKEGLLFRFRKCEVQEEYVDSYDSDYYMVDEVCIENIKSIEELQDILSNYLDDFSKLDVNCGHPY